MNTTFATYAADKKDLLNNYLLASSITDFAGNLSALPLRIYVPSGLDISHEKDKFTGLNVYFGEYPEVRKDVDYSFKSAAACACESEVKSGTVIWLDRHMIVLNPCVNLLLNPLEEFAYRPPHLKLLGASADEPFNRLWETVYKIAEINTSNLFPIYTEVDRKKIWAYFSAGHFSFCAESGIMREWDVLFNRLADSKEVKELFDDETLSVDGETVRIFLHQIALTLAVLRKCNRAALKPLSAFYGYPSHLHNDIDKYYKASKFEQLHTAFYNCNEGSPSMPVSEQVAEWINEKVCLFKKG